jgi:hypothetical protein
MPKRRMFGRKHTISVRPPVTDRRVHSRDLGAKVLLGDYPFADHAIDPTHIFPVLE